MYGSLLIFRVSVRNYALHAPFAKLISLQKCHVEREREPRKGKRAGGRISSFYEKGGRRCGGERKKSEGKKKLCLREVIIRSGILGREGGVNTTESNIISFGYSILPWATGFRSHS